MLKGEKITRRFHAICGLTLIVLFLTLTVFPQNYGLPRLKKGETYKSLRVRMIRAGWKPYHAPNADQCMIDDERCAGRPEMEVCAGTGNAACRFLWKRRGRTVAIITEGEFPAVYSGYEVVKR